MTDKVEAGEGRENLLKILIADDYENSADLLAELLQGELACVTKTAKDGEEAVNRAVSWIPDAVILDIDMPKLSGLEAAQLIRAHFGEQAPLLIAVTAGRTHSEIIASKLFHHVLGKPTNLVLLAQVLKEI